MNKHAERLGAAGILFIGLTAGAVLARPQVHDGRIRQLESAQASIAKTCPGGYAALEAPQMEVVDICPPGTPMARITTTP